MTPRLMEGKPWESINSDGSLNLGSYAVLAAVGMVELAHELLVARCAETGDPVPDEDELRKLARTLLHAADAAQSTLRVDGHVSRMDNSHARARGAIRSALAAYPVPWDANVDGKKAWLVGLTCQATVIIRTAVALIEEG